MAFLLLFLLTPFSVAARWLSSRVVCSHVIFADQTLSEEPAEIGQMVHWRNLLRMCFGDVAVAEPTSAEIAVHWVRVMHACFDQVPIAVLLGQNSVRANPELQIVFTLPTQPAD